MKTNKLLNTVGFGGLFLWAMAGGLTGCSPAENVQPHKQASQTKPVNTFDYNSDWLNIRILGNEDKDAPHLILIPGLVSSPDVWNGVIDTLGKTHKLHLIGVSGFAGLKASDQLEQGVVRGLADNLETYIKAQNLRNVTIMGHSLGGFTALNMAIEHGDSIDKIIIIDSVPYFSAMRDPNVNAESVRLQANRMRDQILKMDAENFKTMQAFTVKRMAKNEAAQENILAWSLASDRATMARGMHDIMIQDRREDLKAIATKTHVIYAWDEGMRMPISQIDTIYKTQYANLLGVHLTRIDGSFHFIMQDQPVEFLQTVQTALNTK